MEKEHLNSAWMAKSYWTTLAVSNEATLYAGAISNEGTEIQEVPHLLFVQKSPFAYPIYHPHVEYAASSAF